LRRVQSHYPPVFEREMGCLEREWRSWLPGAVRAHGLTISAGQAIVAIGAGRLVLQWQTLAPRQIALARFPRLAVQFRFEGVDEAARQDFMRYFDLFMLRGGG
jgi:hypothetical protein